MVLPDHRATDESGAGPAAGLRRLCSFRGGRRLLDSMPKGRTFPVFFVAVFLAADTPPNSFRALDLNTASEADLETLPGLGRGRSELIVRVRRRNGPFRSIEELRALPRFTWKTIDRLRPYLAVKPGEALEASPGSARPQGKER